MHQLCRRAPKSNKIMMLILLPFPKYSLVSTFAQRPCRLPLIARNPFTKISNMFPETSYNTSLSPLNGAKTPSAPTSASSPPLTTSNVFSNAANIRSGDVGGERNSTRASPGDNSTGITPEEGTDVLANTSAGVSGTGSEEEGVRRGGE